MMSHRCRILLAGWLALATSAGAWAQGFFLTGDVQDTQGTPLPGAAVLVKDHLRLGVTTDAEGRYSIEFPHAGPWTVQASFVGHGSESWTWTFERERAQHRFRLKPGTNLQEAEVVGDGRQDVTVQRIDPKLAGKVPTPRGTIEDALLQAPVNFTSELSSAYNVRGGSFDENLVYVNDIEVYRPFLVRSGQQEGCRSPTPTWWTALNSVRAGLKPNTGTS